jgi:predicted RNA binding protein YcfA (HicA-like mRNA interferase family)
MTRLPRLSGRKVISALSRGGFEVIRVRGSHHFLQHPDGRRTVVPVHRSEVIGPGLFAKILRDCELSRADFQKLVRR